MSIELTKLKLNYLFPNEEIVGLPEDYLVIGAPIKKTTEYYYEYPLDTGRHTFVWYSPISREFPYIKPENPNKKEVHFRIYPHGTSTTTEKNEIISSSGTPSRLRDIRTDEITVFQGGIYNGKRVNFYLSLATGEKIFVVNNGRLLHPSKVLLCEFESTVLTGYYNVILRPLSSYDYFSK